MTVVILMFPRQQPLVMHSGGPHKLPKEPNLDSGNPFCAESTTLEENSTNSTVHRVVKQNREIEQNSRYLQGNAHKNQKFQFNMVRCAFPRTKKSAKTTYRRRSFVVIAHHVHSHRPSVPPQPTVGGQCQLHRTRECPSLITMSMGGHNPQVVASCCHS